jgi:serine/threonine protein kinase/tetratricopeptide (TPR) repeat protein
MLLKAQAKAGDFLNQPAADAVGPLDELPVTERPGTVLGPYKLLEAIGEGGFGVVFLAEQSQPMRRRVALKVLKPGMDTRHVIARFEAERQALALMDHPNIARVFEGGETASGRPYFVMELVNGIPITDYCDQSQLTPRERLELFLQVCQAVQHSHQKGIIHRDIKPSNVLVTLHDGTPVPKVIDFGIAKALGQLLTDKTLCTGFAQLIGTPLYMSPEQAALSGLDVDTRSDIYALGVLLYELLTGTTPFDKERFKEVGYDELRRVIREEEPPKPSKRVSTLGQAATTVSTQRKSDPKRLSKLIRGELDWIVMKCLEKDRDGRYETANGLAWDIERYLHDEPVQAYPPSRWYRLRKIVRRNKGPVLAVGLVLMALVGGIIGTTWQAFRAEQARQAEGQRADGERRAREESQRRLTQIEKATEILTAVFRDLDPKAEEKEGKPLRAILGERLDHAVAQLEGESTGDPLTVARIQCGLGQSLQGLGYADQSVVVFSRARETFTRLLGPDHTQTLASMNSLANSYRDLGRYADALKLYEETLTLSRAKLGPHHPQTLASMNNLATSYGALGRHTDALKLHEETLALRKARLGADHADTLASMHNLANSYRDLGRYADALKLHEETLALTKARLGPHHPDTLSSMHAVANCYDALGRLAQALELHKETLALRKAELGPDHPDTLASMNDLASSYRALRRYADALKLYEQTLALRKAKLGPGHPTTLTSMAALATTLARMNRGAEAVPIMNECLKRVAGQVVHPHLIPAMMDLRLRHFEKSKDAAGCRATAEMWEKLKRPDAGSLYDAACMRAVTATVIRATDKSEGAVKHAAVEADRAMAWLKQAAAAGFKSPAHMKSNQDLDALRDREDFKKLLEELEAKSKESGIRNQSSDKQ